MFDPKKILILAPHTDDGELGCGGTIAKFCAAGKQVYYAAFCLKSKTPDSFPSDILGEECRQATSLLGIPATNIRFFDYYVRHLPEQRQRILQQLLDLHAELNPDFVLLPAASDIHQDHQVIHQEGLRAFKNVTFAGYELPWNNYSFHTNFFIRLSENDLNKKIAALNSYQSQSNRNYMNEDFIRSLAKVRGVQANAPFAEAFEIYKWIV
jgi:LmbE family N-acetylglucosaminyl deacetylase